MKNSKLHAAIISLFLVLGMSLTSSCSKSDNDVANENTGGKYTLTIDGKKYTGSDIQRLEDNAVTKIINYKVIINSSIELSVMIPTDDYKIGAELEPGFGVDLVIDGVPYFAFAALTGQANPGKIKIKGKKEI